MKHLMIDIETMGNNSRAPIVSIGACFFLPHTGETGPHFYHVCDISSYDEQNIEGNFEFNGDTIKWWLKQNKNAVAEIVNGKGDIVSLLLNFNDWIKKYREDDIFVWGNGTNFDNVIIRNAYKVFGMKCPFHWRDDTDVRTLMRVARILGYEETITRESKVPHNALDDVMFQIKYVSKAWKYLVGAWKYAELSK